MALLSQRAGRVDVRVGGNTQETAVLVDASNLPAGIMIQKDKAASSNPVCFNPIFSMTYPQINYF